MANVTLANSDATFVDVTGGVPEYSGSELRLADAALLVHQGIARESDTSLAVTVDGSDNVTVQAGSAAIKSDDGTGYYRTGIASAVNGLLSPRDGTNSRIDLVVYEQLDPLGADPRGQITVIEGTPSATPGVPAAPSRSVELARLTVPASGGGAATVDSTRRVYACAAGGILYAASDAALPASAATGQEAIVLDTGYRRKWTGSAWQSVDTAWQTFTDYASGHVADSGRGKMTNRIVQLDGRIDVSGSTRTGAQTAARVPESLRPPTDRSGFLCYLGNSAAVPVDILATGDIRVFYDNKVGGGAGANYLYLNNIRYGAN